MRHPLWFTLKLISIELMLVGVILEVCFKKDIFLFVYSLGCILAVVGSNMRLYIYKKRGWKK